MTISQSDVKRDEMRPFGLMKQNKAKHFRCNQLLTSTVTVHHNF